MKVTSKRLIFFCTLLILASCSNVGQKVSVTEEMDRIISDFILDYNEDKYYETEKQFETHKVYGAAENNGSIEVYIYSLYSGFNKATKDEVQSGRSGPLLISLIKENDTYKVVEYKEPDDGAYYVSSIKEMFPKRYATKAINESGKVTKLEKEMKEKVAVWLEETN